MATNSARFTKEEDKDIYDVLYWNEAFLKKFWDCRPDKDPDEFAKEVMEASSKFTMHFARHPRVIRDLVQDYVSVDIQILVLKRRELDQALRERR